jgi:hypothetical protein
VVGQQVTVRHDLAGLAGQVASWAPVSKKVARTSYSRRIFRTCGRNGPGPSSKVSATVRAAVAGALVMNAVAGGGQACAAAGRLPTL